jgi:hypothetical protein
MRDTNCNGENTNPNEVNKEALALMFLFKPLAALARGCKEVSLPDLTALMTVERAFGRGATFGLLYKDGVRSA